MELNIKNLTLREVYFIMLEQKNLRIKGIGNGSVKLIQDNTL